MLKNRFFPLSLIAVAVLAGCSSMPRTNPTLATATSNYESARTNPQVTKLAPLELQDAGNAVSKAQAASAKGDDAATVDQLAYIAKQKVAIAEEVAKQKNAEQEVANIGAERNQVRLQARTAEADAAQQTADQRAAELKTESARTEEAKTQLALSQQEGDRKDAALTTAEAKAAQDQALIDQQDEQLKALHARKTDRGMVVTLGDVLFNTDQASLSAGGINNARKLAEFMSKYPQRNVIIEGNTDSRGSESHNQALSERRADAVKNALVDMGISSDRITARGLGESSPVATNDSATGRQLNRRVEIIFPEGSTSANSTR
ncbi:MAG: OmpA family protein [Parasulfuritortus sp.]|nr:OmpA family protein [Parasulfuritortus sp.]